MDTLTASGSTEAEARNSLEHAPLAATVINPGEQVATDFVVPDTVAELMASDSSAAQDVNPNSESGSSRWGELRRKATIRAGLELGGAAVDAALLAGAGVGIAPLTSVTGREVVATTGDFAVLDKLQGGNEVTAERETRLRRAGRKIGNLAIGVTTAIVAQKIGVEFADQLHDGLNNGLGEYAVPIASKVGAISGVNALRGRLSSRG